MSYPWRRVYSKSLISIHSQSLWILAAMTNKWDGSGANPFTRS